MVIIIIHHKLFFYSNHNQILPEDHWCVEFMNLVVSIIGKTTGSYTGFLEANAGGKVRVGLVYNAHKSHDS